MVIIDVQRDVYVDAGGKVVKTLFPSGTTEEVTLDFQKASGTWYLVKACPGREGPPVRTLGPRPSHSVGSPGGTTTATPGLIPGGGQGSVPGSSGPPPVGSGAMCDMASLAYPF